MARGLIDFMKIDWVSPAPGVRHRAFLKDGQKLRLVEFSDAFAEAGWCVKGHAGYVINGRIFIEFDGEKVEFKAGDGLFIPGGEADRHRGSVPEGEKALLVMFEKI